MLLRWRIQLDNLKEIVINAQQEIDITLDETRDPLVTIYRFICYKSSKLTLHAVLCERTATALTLEIILQEEGAQAHIVGVAVFGGASMHSVHIAQIHQAPHTVSSSVFKAAITDTAFFNYHGVITITEAARGADAQLYNKNMLLSEHARVQSIPSLEVLTNDVRCKHGTATAAYNKEQILYMQSRGITVSQAQNLLLNAFFLPEMSNKQQELSHLVNALKV